MFSNNKGECDNEMNHRIDKLSNEIFIYIGSEMKHEFIDMIDLNSHEDIIILMKFIRFIVTKLLPYTRWTNESDIVRYTSNDALIEWFANYPIRLLIGSARNNKCTIHQLTQLYANAEFQDPEFFDRNLINTFTGYQKFINKLSYPHFIPGISYPNYKHLNPLYVYHDVQRFFVSNFKEFLKFFKEFSIKPPDSNPDNMENYVPLDLSTELASSYVSGFGYPDPYGWISDYNLSFDSIDKSMNSILKSEKKKYKIWMIQDALKYCIDKIPNRIRYKTKPNRYRNQLLKDAIIDSMFISGTAMNMKKVNEVRKAISHILDKYYDDYPLPCKLLYEDYKSLVLLILDSRDKYCDMLLMKWDILKDQISEYKKQYGENIRYPTTLVKMAKEFIFMASLLDLISRCQYDLMLNFDSNKSILYATSISFNYSNNIKLEEFFNDDGIYDLNEYPVLKHLIFEGIHNAISNMLPKNILNKLTPEIRKFRYHILKRAWLKTEINPNSPSDRDLKIINNCSRRIALYMIRSMGGYIEKASIIYSVNGELYPQIAPLFGRKLQY